jgi:hypothetical protein
MGGCPKGGGPKTRGDGRLNEQGANDIIDGANNAFSFTVLGRGVRARHVEVDAMRGEESAGAEVVKLAAIVALNPLNGDSKLCTNIGKEISESGESVGYQAQGERP